jgi:hypothetical protein
MVRGSAAGSPGPLLTNTASTPAENSLTGAPIGWTRTYAPVAFSRFRMFSFAPPSSTATRQVGAGGSANT